MVEKPVNLEIFDKSVSVAENDHYFTFYADGLKEYERIENQLIITLFSTTGNLENLILLGYWASFRRYDK